MYDATLPQFHQSSGTFLSLTTRSYGLPSPPRVSFNLFTSFPRLFISWLFALCVGVCVREALYTSVNNDSYPQLRRLHVMVLLCIPSSFSGGFPGKSPARRLRELWNTKDFILSSCLFLFLLGACFAKIKINNKKEKQGQQRQAPSAS